MQEPSKKPAKRGTFGRSLAQAFSEKKQKTANKPKVETIFNVDTKTVEELNQIATTKAGVVGEVTPFNGLLRGSLEGVTVAGGWGVAWVRTKDQPNMGILRLQGKTPEHFALLNEGNRKMLIEEYGFSEEHAFRFLRSRERGKYPVSKRLGEILKTPELLQEWFKHPEAFGAESRDEWLQRNHKLTKRLSADNELLLARLVKFVTVKPKTDNRDKRHVKRK